ncbi:hypothetical protein [Campylobacter phage CJLB-14]|nr:hypothetical protein [Campylobacter phage CJLB-14]
MYKNSTFDLLVNFLKSIYKERIQNLKIIILYLW